MATFTPNYSQYMPQIAQSPMIWVKGASQAESYPVAPNATVILWDSDQNTIYIKTTDVLGKPSIKYLDYTIRENTPKVEETKTSEYVTKDDLNSFMEEIRKSIDELKPKTKIKEV